jgi:predicted nucleic acid-binding protein
MLIVADSSALIALATCDGLDLILKIYDDIKIPEAV